MKLHWKQQWKLTFDNSITLFSADIKQVISFAATAKLYIASIKHFSGFQCSQNANQIK